MATEKLQPNQIYTTGATSGHVLTYNGTNAVFSAPASGAAQATKIITLTGGSGDQTTSAFTFVVGLVFIELLIDDIDDAVDVNMCGWVNMRSFGGTKTANITDRLCKFTGSNAQGKMAVDRTTSGTVLVIGRPSTGTDVSPDGSGLASYTAYNWPTGKLRITAIEDTQA